MSTLGAVLFGAILVALGQISTVKLLDAGFIRPRFVFYLAVSVAPVFVGAVLGRRWRAVVGALVGALVTTYLVYKVGVQPGVVSELGNDFDWAMVLLLTATVIPATALVSQRRGANGMPAGRSSSKRGAA